MSNRRLLSQFDVVCLGFNAIVGSGIYLFPGILAQQLGPASVLAFACCGVMSLLIGLCFVEVSGMFQHSGGPYVYARHAYGDLPGYMVGWTCWAAAVLSWAAVASAVARDLGQLLFAGSSEAALLGLILSLLITGALGVINYLGVKPGAYTLDTLTVVKLLPLLVLLAVGLFQLQPARLTPFAPHGLAELPGAAYLAFFAFQGFEVVPVPAGETANPRRNAPVAVFSSIVGATTLYILIQLVAVGTTPTLAGSSQPLVEMGRTLLGGIGGKLVGAAGLVSMLGFCAGVALSGPRYLQALAQDGHVPRRLASLHPRFDTPHLSIAATTLVTAALITTIDFRGLVDLAVLTVGVQYLATCMAVPTLRWRRPDLPRTFSLPGGPVIPMAATLIVLLFGSLAEAHKLRWFMVMLAAGLPLKLLGLWLDRKDQR